VRFSQPLVDTTTNGTFNVSLLIEGGTDIASSPMQIRWDPKMLRLNDAVRGEFFSSDGQQPIFTKNILNDGGVASIQLSRIPGTAGMAGNGTLVTLSFQAIGKGTAQVTVTFLGVKNSQGQDVPATPPQLTVNIR
jgi:general secretion pathway protein D